MAFWCYILAVSLDIVAIGKIECFSVEYRETKTKGTTLQSLQTQWSDVPIIQCSNPIRPAPTIQSSDQIRAPQSKYLHVTWKSFMSTSRWRTFAFSLSWTTYYFFKFKSVKHLKLSTVLLFGFSRGRSQFKFRRIFGGLLFENDPAVFG